MSRSRGRYNRVWPEIWDEPWSDDARSVAFYLLTCRHRTTEGLYRLPLAYATEDIGWPVERFREGLAELLREGFAKYDEAARVVLILKALKRQPLENPNQVKSAVGQVAALPETPLLSELAALAERYCQRFAEGLRERFPEGFGEPLALALPPTPTPEAPPTPPVGGRARDRESFEEEMRAWCRSILDRFPDLSTILPDDGAPERHVRLATDRLRSARMDATPELVRDRLVAQYAEAAA